VIAKLYFQKFSSLSSRFSFSNIRIACQRIPHSRIRGNFAIPQWNSIRMFTGFII
jgi:hypothetical protein